MRSTDPVPRTVPAGVKNGTKLLRLKISSKQGQLQAGNLQTDAVPDPALGSSNSSNSQQTSSLLYSHQLWQASGYCLHQCTLSRDVYFPELSVPAAVFKKLPLDGLEPLQQKRAKLCNGQYRSKAAAAGLTADHVQPSGVQTKEPHRHVAHGWAAAASAAVAAQQQWVSTYVAVSPSSSSSHDGGQPVCQSTGTGIPAAPSQTAQLRVLPVPWPLVAVKGQRSSRQRRSNIVQWRNAVLPASAALQPVPSAPGAGSAAADEQQQQVDEQNTQQHGVLQQSVLDHQQSGVLHGGEQQLLGPSAGDVVMQEQHQQSKAAALLQLSPALAPVSAQPSPPVADVDPAPAEVVAGQLLPGKANTAAGDASPVETSTSSEQTHDDMNDSPRDQTRVPLSSWPSSSTDSICQLQQQQQQLSLALQQQCGQGSLGVTKHASTSAAAGWASPSSPLPASAL